MNATEFSYDKKTARDAEEHAISLSAWNQTYQQLSAGPFNAALEEMHVGGVQVFRERANRSMYQQGMARDGTVTLGVTQCGPVRGWYCGHRLEGRQMIGLSSQDEFELVTGEEMGLIAVCVDVGQLTELALRVRGPAFQFRMPHPGVLKAGKTEHDELAGLLQSAMALAEERPELLSHSAARRMLAHSLRDLVLACIDPSQATAALTPSARVRRRIVATARDHMRNHSHEAIAVPELCAVTGVSRRALQYAFEDVLNVSPLTYLRAMRLNGVRRELREPGCDTVGDVAARWGFWHLSRFAADYRQMFGELPSATRASTLGQRNSTALLRIAH